jgi:hypothetical protein
MEKPAHMPDLQQNLGDALAASWSAEDTRDYLDTNPLPPGFTWRHKDGTGTTTSPAGLVLTGQRPVQPSYSVASYGKWLRETPNFQGLFEEIHRIILRAGATLPDIEAIAAELVRRHPHHEFAAEKPLL